MTWTNTNRLLLLDTRSSRTGRLLIKDIMSRAALLEAGTSAGYLPQRPMPALSSSSPLARAAEEANDDPRNVNVVSISNHEHESKQQQQQLEDRQRRARPVVDPAAYGPPPQDGGQRGRGDEEQEQQAGLRGAGSRGGGGCCDCCVYACGIVALIKLLDCVCDGR